MRETGWWRSGTIRRALFSSLLSLATVVVAGVCLAMPAARRDDGSAIPLRPSTMFRISTFNDLGNGRYVPPYRTLFDLAPKAGEALTQVEGKGPDVPLTQEERDKLRTLFGEPGNPALGGSDVGLANANPLTNQSETQQVVADINAFYGESHSNGLSLEPNGGGGGSGSATGRAQSGTSPVLRVVKVRSNDDIPILSAIPIGTLFVETVKSLVDSGTISHSFVSELRDFSMVNEPASGSLMLVDGNSNYTFMLVSPKTEDVLAPFKDASPQETTEHRRPRDPVPVAHRPLFLKIWDIATSLGAFVFYAIALVCWGAWHYLISRYA